MAKKLARAGSGARWLSKISVVTLILAVLEIVANPDRSPREHAGRIVLSIVTTIAVSLLVLKVTLTLAVIFVFLIVNQIVYYMLEKFVHDPVMRLIGVSASAQLTSGTSQAPQFGSQPSSEWAEILQYFPGHLMPGQCVLSGEERDIWGRPSIDDAHTLHDCVEKLFSLPLRPIQCEPKTTESRRRSLQSKDFLNDEISRQLEAIMEEMVVCVEEYRRDSEGDVGRLVDYLGREISVIEPAPEGIWEKIGGMRAECLCFDMPVLADRRSDRSISVRSRAIRVSIAATVRSLEGKILGKVDEEGLMNLADDSEQFMDLLACLEGDDPPSRGAEYS